MSRTFFEQFESETAYSAEIAEKYHRRGYWGDTSVGEYLVQHAQERPDDTAVIDDSRSVTWKELRELADGVAAGLQDLGIERGDRVAFQLSDSVEWFALRLGVTRAGGVSVPVYPRFGVQEVEHTVESVAPRVYVSDKSDEVLETVLDLRDTVDELAHVFSLREDAGGVSSFESLRGDANTLSPKQIDPDYPDVLALSSGTTGLPKIYYVPQNTYLSTGKDVMGRCCVTEYDTVMALAPIQQALGHIVSLYLALASGATSAVTSTNDPEKQWKRLSEDTPAFVGAIPTQTARLLNSDVADSYSLVFVRSWLNGGAPLPTEVAKGAEEKGANVVNGYGAGDGGWATTARPMDPFEMRTTTVGPHHPATEVRVVDDDGEPVPTGEVGEVLITGAGCCFGYFEDRGRTEKTFDVGGPLEGWFHSNDAGTIDTEGNLTIVGRLDDMIVRGGQNVYPAEIEDVLMEHEAVVEAAVIGMPDPELGERVAAYVVEESGSEVTHEEVVEWFDDRGLAKFKWPERLEKVESLPKSPGGKIKKTDLHDDIEAQLKSEGKL
jgi:acyl-CoA synthetase (AMP-forming)/AMP-acid ligase II